MTFKFPLLALLLVVASFSMAQPIANFSATPLSGCAPLPVSFTDLSTGTGIPTTYQWDLGNGTLSTQQNPTTTYFTPGIYTITLTVTNPNGSHTLTRNQYITVNDKPSVNFIASDSVGCFPLRVNFSDLSTPGTGSNTSWEWDFGDGGTSTQQNPFHVYATAGNFTVTLKVTNSGGCFRVLSKTQYIRVSQGVSVNFTNTFAQLCHPPENIQFTNLATGPGTLSHQWFFGDGGNSTALNPSHTYTAAGTYTITLITQSNLGCVDTLVRTAVIIRDVVSSFAGPDSICVNQSATFSNTSTAGYYTPLWSFGDGTTSTDSMPTKAWATPGIYPIQLINAYGPCADTVVKPIRVLALPTADFTSNDSIDCDAPFTVNFQSTAVGAVGWNWSFGDGATSTQQNPVHTYTANGQYTVTLIVTNASGCRDTIVKTNYIRIARPTVGIIGAPVEGCIPFTFMPTPNVTAIDGVANYLWSFGDGNTSPLQNPTNIYPIQGTYTVKLFITTNDGCVDSSIVTNGVRVGSLPVADFSAAPLSQCVGQVVQFTDLSVPADRWLWDFGNGTGSATAQNPQYVYPDTGIYTIRLIAWNNGCPDTMVKPSYITALPPVARFTPSFNCNNKRQVSFTDQSVLPQTWFWDFGDGNTSTLPNPVHTYTNFGSYVVSLTVTNGSCSHTYTATVTLFAEQADFISVRDTVCKKTGQAVFFVPNTVNTANIATYYWDFGDGIAQLGPSVVQHFYDNPGLYTVTLVITDIRGCRDTIVKPNTIRVWGPTSSFTPSPLTGCRALTVNFTDASTTDGVHPITAWAWHYGDGQSQTLTAGPYSHVYDTAGSFIASLKVTDSYGCTDSSAFATPIFITDPQARFSSADTLTCIGAPVVFANASTGINLTYAWNFGNGNLSNTATPTIAYAADGNYTVTLTVTDSIGCIDSLRLTDYIKVRTSDASFTVNDSISSCAPFEVVFTNTSLNRTSQVWDFGDGTTSTLLSPTHYYNTPGTYIVKLVSTGPGGCTDSAFKTIILYPSTATLTYNPLSGCSPLPVNFYVSTPGPVTYLWDFNDGSTLSNTDSVLIYNYLLPGNFVPKVILEDQTGCLIPITGFDTIRVTRSDVDFGVSDSVFCDRGTVTFSDSTTSNAPITNYFWSFGDGGTSILQNPVHTYNAPGSYTVQLIVRTLNGCEDTLTKPNFIKVVASPQISIGGTFSGCEPSTLNFLGLLLAADTATLSWNWSFGNGNNDTARNPLAQTYSTAGTYPLQLIVINSTGCADTANQNIIINPLPNTFAGNDTILCQGTPLQLLATGAANYTWQPAAGLSCTNCANPISNTNTSQWYYVTGSTAFGCTSTDSVFVRVKDRFTLTVNPLTDSLCLGQSVQLNASAAENYSWFPASGLSNTNIANPVASPTTSTVYKLVAFDTVGCFRDSAFVNISVFPFPTVEAGPNRTISAGTSTVISPLYSADASNWAWSPSIGLSCNNCPAPTASPRTTTTYTIRVSNSGGCSASDALTVFVTCNNENVFIPNTFSPNNDGVNDVFYPRGRGLFQIESMRIFNRWGEMVFQRTNFTANDATAGWNGRYKGIAANPDVYTYIIEVVCDNSEVIPFKGNITLIQ